MQYMENFFEEIPEYLSPVIALLEENGFEAYLVGGCVRDRAMGREPNDYDLATSATPEEMCRVFSGYRLIETGLKHGTVTVCSDGKQIEITTYRIDGAYSDNRHPETVSFTRKLTEDLSRRDFTVNAMAYSPERGVCDPFGGMADIERRIVACVGDPEQRFREDGLRIMRAVRFASTLDFSVDEATASAACRLSHLLAAISRERVYTEFSKLLCGVGSPRVLGLFSNVLNAAVPRLSGSTFVSCAPQISKLPADPVVRIAFLAASEDVTAPGECADEVMASLKSSTADRRRARLLASERGKPLPETERGVRRLMSRMSHENVVAYAAMHSAFTGADGKAFALLYSDVRRADPCVSIKQLAVNGNDVMELTPRRGGEVGEALAALLCRVVDGEISNTREELTRELLKL